MNNSEFIKWLLGLFLVFFRNYRHKKKLAINAVADMMCVNTLTIRRWIQKENIPSALAKVRLEHIREIFKVLSEKLPGDEIVWLYNPNDFLGGERPIDLLLAMSYKKTELVLQVVKKM